MKRISFNQRFVNEAGDNLIERKIHTIRTNYDFWKKFEGREVELFTWEGKAYQKGSTHKVFCTKKIVSVQEVTKSEVADFWVSLNDKNPIPIDLIAKNDGFNDKSELVDWFIKLPFGSYVILHFTDFRY